MNYLAHAYLSFGEPHVLLGNMISDYVKGKAQYDYPPAVQRGIQLHRSIDAFTDRHPATHTIMEFFRPQYRLYAGAFTDIVYDYFLANDTTQFENEDALMQFTQLTYAQLQPAEALMPERFRMMFPYMTSQNWLYNYRHEAGMQKSFMGLVRRAAYLYESDIAFEIFLANKNAMQEQYNLFFDSVKKHASAGLSFY